jgi:hypothetical protein
VLQNLRQALTYLKIAPWRWGVMDIRYRRVQCTPPEDVKVRALAIVVASRLGVALDLSMSSEYRPWGSVPWCQSRR